ncbi:MAG: 6,7-dimethyl-8-ribityllumazine synthase [Spirochaetales bacterium]|nr:6,7-dimethyl-8-ribityllumazine synthase [Spirochaetales bacterium]
MSGKARPLTRNTKTEGNPLEIKGTFSQDRYGEQAIVVARFNEFITGSLLQGALSAYERHGLGTDRITVVHVPGAFELGITARRLAMSGKFKAVVCLGAVIRGATPHFDHVCNQAARLIAQAGYDSGVPVIFGVLTTDTIEQAIERAGTKAGNKGYEAAQNALEMSALFSSL